MTLVTIGSTAPVQAAWMMRPARMKGKPGASAAVSDPAANSAVPPTNSLRVEKCPIRQAASGMTTASTIAYPEVSHWTVVADTPVSAMMAGSAGVSRVMLSTATSVPVRSTPTIASCFLSTSRNIVGKLLSPGMCDSAPGV